METAAPPCLLDLDKVFSIFERHTLLQISYKSVPCGHKQELRSI